MTNKRRSERQGDFSQDYPCPCCGYLVFAAEPPGTYLTCPICLWEDADPEGERDPTSGLSLRQAQRHFIAVGASSPVYVSEVRPPGPQEPRQPNWTPLDTLARDLHTAALTAIEEAFGTLSHPGGKRIYEAELEDNYGTESATTLARKNDTYSRWQEVPDEAVEQCSDALVYFDSLELRFHLPAYMTWALKYYRESGSVSGDYVIYCLDCPAPGARRDAWLERFAELDLAQRAAVCLFLRYMAKYSDGDADASAARRALEGFWHQYEKPIRSAQLPNDVEDDRGR
jgi:hypothetical protein